MVLIVVSNLKESSKKQEFFFICIYLFSFIYISVRLRVQHLICLYLIAFKLIFK